MKRPQTKDEFTAEYQRIRREMQQQISQVTGDAFLVALMALQYAVVSLRLQHWTQEQIQQLVREVPVTPAPHKTIN